MAVQHADYGEASLLYWLTRVTAIAAVIATGTVTTTTAATGAAYRFPALFLFPANIGHSCRNFWRAFQVYTQIFCEPTQTD